MIDIWVTKTTYEKNSSDGITVYKSREALAEGVAIDEAAGGRVQVFKCMPVSHEVYYEKYGIEIDAYRGGDES